MDSWAVYLLQLYGNDPIFDYKKSLSINYLSVIMYKFVFQVEQDFTESLAPDNRYQYSE